MPDTNDPTNDIDALLRYLKSGHTPHWYDDSTRWHAALTALVAERDALRDKVKEHAEDRRKYIDAWADWIEANAGLEIDQWLRVYADAVPIPSLDGDEAKQRIFKHLDQRMRDASDAIDALRKLVEYMKALNTAAASIICERDALKQRAAELEARAKPVYITDGERVESIDLRERLVCAIWPELLRLQSEYAKDPRVKGDPREQARRFALVEADAMLAAMREGESHGK